MNFKNSNFLFLFWNNTDSNVLYDNILYMILVIHDGTNVAWEQQLNFKCYFY